MVSTRLQTGAINTRKYTPLSISVQGLSLASNPSSPIRSTNRKHGAKSPTKIIKPTSPRASSRKGSRTATLSRPSTARNMPTLTDAEMVSLNESLRRNMNASGSSKSSSRSAKSEGMSAGTPVFSSVSFGAKEEVGFSKIGRADKNIKLWAEVLITHQKNAPELVPQVEQRLQEARDKRAQLDDTLEENTRVGDIDPKASAIKKRLDALEWALSTSKFGPEGENIKCAIAGYKSGAIEYSEHFTIIYGAKIVDTAPTYESFVNDRSERLDRYYALYGEGWLWYEPPLNKHPSAQPKALLAATLKREQTWSNLGCYNVNQGFWKRSNFVRRMTQMMLSPLAENDANFLRDPTDPEAVDCQNDGPRLSWWTLLDSGATFPSLYNDDLIALGIDKENYGAQCVDSVITATGEHYVRIWELFVSILDEHGRHLVDNKDPVWPRAHQYLGGLCPISENLNQLAWDENGIEIAQRLSGMLPFVACYVGCAPTRDYLFLGEDRNDVLGSHRMPGQKKWRIELPPITPGLPFDRYDNPHVSFIHRRGEITDIDHPTVPHVSTLTFLPGTANETVIHSNPGNRVIV